MIVHVNIDQPHTSSPAQSRWTNWYIVALCLLIIFAFAMRLWRLGTQSLWHDEAWSIFSAYHPLALASPETDPNTPPGFYLTLSAWMQLVGDGIWTLRLWSAMLGVLLVPATASLARRWFGGHTAILSAILVSVSPLLWVYSQEIRAYIAVPLFALLFLFLSKRLLTRPDRTAWITTTAVELFALYTHNLSVALVAWLNVALLSVWLHRRDWRRMAAWLGLQLIALFCYIPWALTQHPTGTRLNILPSIEPGIIWTIWQSFFSGVPALLNVDAFLMLLIACLGVLVIVGVLGAVLWRRTLKLYLVATQAALVTLFELAIIYAARIDFHPRYMIAGVPAVLILAAVGFDTIRHRLWPAPTGNDMRSHLGLRLAKYIGGAWVVMTLSLPVTISARALTLQAGNPVYQHDDFRAITNQYRSLAPADAIIVPYGWEPTLAYYASKLGIRAQIVNIPLNSPWTTIVERLNSLHARHVEVLTWYQLPADLRGVYPCLLGAASPRPSASFTAIGLTTTAYDEPASVRAVPVLSTQISFAPFDLQNALVVTGSTQSCLITEWTLEHQPHEPVSESYRVAAGLTNPLGWTFARSNADLRDDRQRPTPYWVSGQSGTAFNAIQYPPAVAAGRYTATISLYSADTLRGVDIIRDGAPVGQSAAISAIQILPAVPDVRSLAAYSFTALNATIALALPADAIITGCQLQPGQEFRVTALWKAPPAANSSATLELAGSGWHIGRPMPVMPDYGYRLSWYAYDIPARAGGRATLSLVGSDRAARVLQTCEIVTSDHLYSAPPIPDRLNVPLGNFATLEGFDVSDTSITSHAAFSITLFWKARSTPNIGYTVFTHLLDEDGRVIAQDDSQPAQGQRPTTGWVAGEYIVDAHELRFNTQGLTYNGAATLEIGLYDAASGRRVLASNGADHVLLPVKLAVK